MLYYCFLLLQHLDGQSSPDRFSNPLTEAFCMPCRTSAMIRLFRKIPTPEEVGLVIAILPSLLAASALATQQRTNRTYEKDVQVHDHRSLHSDQNEDRSGDRCFCQNGGHRRNGAYAGDFQTCPICQWLPFYLYPPFHRALHSLGGLELTM